MSMDLKGIGRRVSRWTFLSAAVLFLSTISGTGQAEEKLRERSKSSGGFIDFNVYPYSTVDNGNVFTINAFAKLSDGFSYFSLTNFGNSPGRDELADIGSFYTEQNLRRALPGNIPFDLTLQWNLRSGKDNDRLRLGIRWKANETPGIKALTEAAHLAYTINFHLLQFDHTDGYIWQMEHVYRIEILPTMLDHRLFIGGFADHTFGGPNDPEVVTEHQVGIRFYDWWHAAVEYRYNGYRTGAESSLGFGLEYVIQF